MQDEITALELSEAYYDAEDHLFEIESPFVCGDGELTGEGMHERARLQAWYNAAQTAEQFRVGVASSEWPN